MYWLRKDWHTRMFLLRSRHHTSSWFSRRAISGSTPNCWMTSSSELCDWSCDSLLVMSSVCVYGGGPGGVGAVSGWWCRCWLVMGCGWGGGMGWLSSNSTLLTRNRDSRHQISQLDKDMVYHSLTSQHATTSSDSGHSIFLLKSAGPSHHQTSVSIHQK